MKYLAYISKYSVVLLISFCLITACDDFIDIGDPEEEETFVKYYGGDYGQEAHDLLIDQEGNFLMLGASKSFKENDQDQVRDFDIYLVKAGPKGKFLGSYTYDSKFGHDIGYKIIELGEGYLLCGEVARDKGKQGVLLLLSRNLTLEGTVFLGKAGESTSVNDILLDTKGNFIIAGTTTDIDTLKTGKIDRTKDVTDIFLASVPIDLGSVHWQDSYGYGGKDSAFAIANLNNGQYAILGTTDFGETVSNKIMVVTISPQGGITHTFNFPDDEMTVLGNDILYDTTESQLLLLGTTQGFNSEICLIKTDRFLTMETITHFDEFNPGESSTIEGTENGFLLMGSTSYQKSKGFRDMLLLQTNAEGTGYKYPDPELSTQTFGSIQDDRGADVALIPNSTEVAILGTCGFGATDMFCLIKMDVEEGLPQ